MKILLYQPDIAGNVGTIARLCKCLALELNIIEPCGFLFDDKKLLRSGMDYLDFNDIKKYNTFDDFKKINNNVRIVLLTTKAKQDFDKFKFLPNDVLMVGRESSGVPEGIHEKVDEKIVIPMKNNSRSINVAVSLSMAVSVAMKDCKLF